MPAGYQIFTDFVNGANFGPGINSIDKPQKNYQLIKQMDMDISDLLLHLFKDQPRVIGTNFYQYEHHFEGRRHFQQDEAKFRGKFVIYYRSTPIATIVKKPHKRVKILPISNKASRSYFAQQLMLRALHDLFPEAKVKVT